MPPFTLQLFLLGINNYISLFLAKMIFFVMYVYNFIVCYVKGTAEKQ